jgi:hypothetical protein
MMAEEKLEEPQCGAQDLENGREETNRRSDLARMFRAISRASDYDPGPPPDGGFHAWMQVVLVHISVINTWGFLNSFGVSPCSRFGQG